MFIKPHVCSPNALVIVFMKCSISLMPLPCVRPSAGHDLLALTTSFYAQGCPRLRTEYY